MNNLGGGKGGSDLSLEEKIGDLAHRISAAYEKYFFCTRRNSALTSEILHEANNKQTKHIRSH